MYKNRSKRIVKYVLLSVMMMFICVLSIFLIVNDAETKEIINKKLAEENAGSFIKITDNYDRHGYESFFEFVKQEDSLVKLQRLYQEFVDSEILDYFEVAEQPVELIGEYALSDEFVCNDQVELKDQTILYEDGAAEYLTPIKTVQIGRETLDKLNVRQYFEDNMQIMEEDFVFTDKIPVVLGYHYKKYCKAGDIIPGMFLNQKVDFVVKGFFCKDAALSFDNQTYDLNHIFLVFLGNLAADTNKEYEDAVVLYSVKSEGYFFYNSAESYTASLRELERLAQQYQLEYTFVLDERLYEEPNHNVFSYLLACIVFNSAIFVILFSMGKDCIQGDTHGRVHCIKYAITALFLFTVSLYAAFYLSLHYFRYTVFIILFLQQINVLIKGMVIYCLIAILIFYTVVRTYEKRKLFL